MCRFIAYIGEPVTALDLLVVPPHSLFEQCRSPRHQTRTKDNPDGFGISWFNDDGVVERYRKPIPMWEDGDLSRRAATIVSGSFLAAIRKATPGLAICIENTAPYLADNMTFAHNGGVDGWVRGITGKAEALGVSATRLAAIEGTTDSEMLFGAILTRLDDGMSKHDAVTSVCVDIGERFGGYLNFLLSDGSTIYATSWGNSLFTLQRDGAVVVASEPFDNHDDWVRVPDRMYVQADRGGLAISPLAPERVSP